MPHLSDDELEAFYRRTAEPAALVEIDGHLSECADCRRRLSEVAPIDSLYTAAKAALGQDPDQPHLAYEEVKDAAEGQPSKMAAAHLVSCPECRDEVADLRQFLESLAQKPRPRRTPVIVMMRRWAIAALLLIALPVAWWMWRRGAEPDYVVRLRDGGGWVGLDQNGQLHTPAEIPADDAAALKDALSTGRLSVPQPYRGAAPEVLLGPAPQSVPPLSLTYPVGEAILTAQPQFEWRASSVGNGYRVRVYDRNFHLVMESPELHTEAWTPDTPLSPGQQYTWDVTARLGSHEFRAPLPPAPEARFAILSQAETSRLESLRRQYPSEHLMLAAVFARAGALRPARQELDALGRANPGSALVRQIAPSLGPAPRDLAPHQTPNSSKPAQ